MNGVKPKTFQLSSQGIDQAYYLLNDNGNDVFDPDERIIFWGQEFNGERLGERYSSENQFWGSFTRQMKDGTFETWTPQFNGIMVEKYIDSIVYWLSWGLEPGIRMQEIAGTPGTAPIISQFWDELQIEGDNVWRVLPFTSEETWFHKVVELPPDQTINRNYSFT